MENENLKQPRDEVEELKAEQGTKLSDAMETLRSASESGESATIEGRVFDNPAMALENIQRVLAVLEQFLPFSKDDIYFKSFGGDTLGESSEGRVEADPIMLMHPFNRLAHVLFHEISHSGDDVENEALVEERARALLRAAGLVDDDLQFTDAYSSALEKFREFADRVREDKSLDETIEEVYQLYYSGKYEEVYRLYKVRYIDRLASEKEQDKAFDLFAEVFPELEVKGHGHFEVVEV